MNSSQKHSGTMFVFLDYELNKVALFMLMLLYNACYYVVDIFLPRSHSDFLFCANVCFYYAAATTDAYDDGELHFSYSVLAPLFIV